ncbi:CBS domain-containing protein [Bacteriovorax stolpii]|uniref:Uncharacterized protein n=1 Tax=Bacteriovorax stolpii TaxID=960 RepID=A0A2K9NPM0_BACTC|nr:CBS domain-containing protein [Bacteriovorax stolpii]AUN97448.1 hypothetical protein C0V70_04855 [Bacteriovorax stolpii]QDK42581.1 CBS domain-containing protein [Bacteriovorax stolpii]TDP52625.1 CBS domain protein [Bacteriovorax stolpii]BDT27560.1 CBS domain-containing protein [Bacteriovorax sp. HI3]
MNQVTEIMNNDPMFCTSETRIAEIKHLLKKYDYKELLVLDSEKDRHPIGVVSLEDMASEAIEHGAMPSDTSAVECMRSIPAVVAENSSYEECLNVMRQNHMDFIPVVDMNGHVTGVVEREKLTKMLM